MLVFVFLCVGGAHSACNTSIGGGGGISTFPYLLFVVIGPFLCLKKSNKKKGLGAFPYLLFIVMGLL